MLEIVGDKNHQLSYCRWGFNSRIAVGAVEINLTGSAMKHFLQHSIYLFAAFAIVSSSTLFAAGTSRAAETVVVPKISTAAKKKTTSREQRRTFEKIIREYILNHPEVVTQAIQLSRARQEARERRGLQQAITTRSNQLVNDPDAPIRGNPNGDVTIVEFLDYRCGYCRRAHPIVNALLEKDDKVRIIYKDIPILGDESMLSARAALAAQKQGKYMEFHDALFVRQSRMSFTESNLLDLAAELELDANQMKVDMYGDDVTEQIAKNLRLASSLSISGTPSFIVGDKIVPGLASYQQFTDMIAEIRGAYANAGVKK